MMTSMGYFIFHFSIFMVFSSFIALTASSHWRAMRAPAVRMLVVFAVAAISGSYVWLEAGPTVDYRLQANNAPVLLFEAPHELSI